MFLAVHSLKQARHPRVPNCTNKYSHNQEHKGSGAPAPPHFLFLWWHQIAIRVNEKQKNEDWLKERAYENRLIVMLFNSGVNPAYKRFGCPGQRVSALHLQYIDVVLVSVTSALQASESGCWLTNPLCTPHSYSSALLQLLTSIQNSPGGDLQSCQSDSTHLGCFGFCVTAGTTWRVIFPFMDYALISRFVCNSKCDGISKSGLWRTGWIYPMAKAGHEEWIHNM